jgi:hypothetical protein
MELIGVVQALSEYKPTFADVDTAPLEGKFGDVEAVPAGVSVFVTKSVEEICGELERAAKVVTDKASPSIISPTTNTVAFDSLRFEATAGVVGGIVCFDAVTANVDSALLDFENCVAFFNCS